MKPMLCRTPIPLVFAVDESFAMPLATALRSIVEAKTTIDPLEVFVLHNTFQRSAQQRVMNSLPAGTVSIYWIPVDLSRFEGCWTSPHISTAITFARLLLPELLAPKVNRILYLDADILVFDDLLTLFETDLSGAPIGAVLDGLDSKMKAGETLWTNKLPNVKNYFNAGVLLIDLDRWRDCQITERALEYLNQYPLSPLSDQDALNVVCDGTWKQLEPRWNFLNDYKKRLLGRTGAGGPAIIHFAGLIKPWQIGVLDPNAGLYDQIRSRTYFARTNLDKLRDYFAAPLRFYQSGLLWQLKRALRRSEILRRIWRYRLPKIRAEQRKTNRISTV